MSKKKERLDCAVCSNKVKKVNAKFCSSKCFAKYNFPKEITYCELCGKEKQKRCLKYCSRACNGRAKHNYLVDKWLAGEIDGVVAESVTANFIKQHLIGVYGEKCQKCNWNERNPVTNRVPIHLDHIDGNWNNNRPENLILLCPNCHSLTTTYGSLNKGNGRPFFIQKGLKQGVPKDG